MSMVVTTLDRNISHVISVKVVGIEKQEIQHSVANVAQSFDSKI